MLLFSALSVLLLAPAFCDDVELAGKILEWRGDWPGVRVKVPVKVYRLYMRSLLEREPQLRPRAPVDHLVSRAEYAARIDDNMLRLHVRIDLAVINREAVEPIPVLAAGIPWEGIEVNGKKAAVREEGEWLYLDNPAGAAFADEPDGVSAGSVTVSAQTDLRGRRAAGTYSVSLLAVPAVMSVLRVDSDGAWEVRTPSAPLPITGTEKGTRGALALIPHTGKGDPTLRITWRHPRPPVSRLGNVLYQCYLAWHLGEGIQEVRAGLNVRIVGGERESLEIQLPRGADRIKVTGPDVREVRTNGQSAMVQLKGSIAGATRLQVQFALPWLTGRGKVSLDEFGIRGGRLEGGALIVSSAAGGVVLEEEAQGLREMGLWEVPEEAASLAAAAPVLAYGFTGRPWRAVLDAVSLAEFPVQETLIDEASYTVLLRQGGNAMHKVIFRMRNRNRQFLRVRLPGAEDRLILARVAERPVPVSRATGGWLLIPLEKSVETMGGGVSFPVELVFLSRGPALQHRGRLSLPLAGADIPAAQARCTVYLPAGFETKEWEGPLRLSEELTSAVERMEYGRGHVARAAPEQPVVTKQERAELLGSNYLFSATEAYGRGDLDQAEEAARQVIAVAPESRHAGEAEKLMSNILMLKGKRKAVARSGRAFAQQLREGEEVRGEKIFAEQQTVLRRGWELARKGEDIAAAEAFQAAEELGRPLAATPAGGQRQEAALAEAQQWGVEYEKERQRNIELQKKRAALLTYRGAVTAGVSGGVRAEDATLGRLMVSAAARPAAPMVKEDAPSGVQAPGRVAMQRATGKGARLAAGGSLAAENIKLQQDIAQLEKAPTALVGFSFKARLPGAAPRPAKEAEVEMGEAIAIARVGEVEARKQADMYDQGWEMVRQGRFDEAEKFVKELKYRDRAAEGTQVLDEGGSRAGHDFKMGSINGRPEKELMELLAETTEQAVPYKDLSGYPEKDVWMDRIARRKSDLDRERDELLSRIAHERRKAAVTRFNIEDLVESEAEGRALAEFLARNYDIPRLRDVDRDLTGPLAADRVVGFTNGNIEWRDIKSAPQVSEALENLRRNLGQKVTMNTREVALSERQAAELGVAWNSIPGGNWAVIEEGQLGALLTLEQRTQVPGRRIRRGQREVVAGTSMTLDNAERLRLEVAMDFSNTMRLPGQVVEVPHEKVLLVSNEKGIVALRAGGTQFWTEAPEASEIEEVPMEIHVPAVGVPVRFEKVLVGPEDRLVIECNYSYEEVR